MYIAAFAIWLGWGLLFGSPTVLAALLLLWFGIVLIAVPSEERKLEAHFGEQYRRYKEAVPRWIGGRPSSR
jgi:protein-S-isoprenylcysteine O-methyltransferase Ste14